MWHLFGKRDQVELPTFEVLPRQICNVSKIPASVEENPLVRIAKVCVDHPREHAWKATREILSDNLFATDKTLADYYGITSGVLAGFPANVVFLPWTHRRVSDRYHDVFFQIFKDVEYQQKQFQKMYDLVSSFKERGYRPDLYPTRQKGISGYFLSKAGRRVFYVVSGNHRVAALSAMFPETPISAVLVDLSVAKDRDLRNTAFSRRKTHPIEFSIEDIASWPSVKSGFIEEDTAAKIFSKYFGERF